MRFFYPAIDIEKQSVDKGWPEAINIVNRGRKSVDTQTINPTVPEVLYKHTYK